jgi:hypothetical protein
LSRIATQIQHPYAESLAPNEEIEFTLSDKQYEKLKRMMGRITPIANINDAAIGVTFVVFRDDTAWGTGSFMHRDPSDPTRWVDDNLVEKFDVTPDRVVMYLWPAAGGVDFSFTFRARLRMSALAQPSVLYDYYNPDERVSLAPVRFVVR